ncbi:tetratricopeptide repeat protein, partial [Streptomyces sp. H27-D2]|uniref:tetratricopeptide repeat protein n=1 Tax=Streptomyces sp. H27-D2 TaxID=3046304 RepID=UPI002DB79810
RSARAGRTGRAPRRGRANGALAGAPQPGVLAGPAGSLPALPPMTPVPAAPGPPPGTPAVPGQAGPGTHRSAVRTPSAAGGGYGSGSAQGSGSGYGSGSAQGTGAGYGPGAAYGSGAAHTSGSAQASGAGHGPAGAASPGLPQAPAQGPPYGPPYAPPPGSPPNAPPGTPPGSVPGQAAPIGAAYGQAPAQGPGTGAPGGPYAGAPTGVSPTGGPTGIPTGGPSTSSSTEGGSAAGAGYAAYAATAGGEASAAGSPEQSPPALAPLDVRTTGLALPVPRVDPADPNAGFLAGLMASAPAELISALESAPADSIERRLRALRARLEMDGERGAASEDLKALEARHPDDWRVVWYRGLVSLVSGDRETAALSFDAVYDAFPGEPAPKLALGVCAELLGQLDNAAEYYRLVWTTDPSYVSAAFGLARVRLAAGDRQGAVRALESVPEASIHYTAARVAAVRARLRQRAAYEPLLDDLTASARQVERLRDFGLDAVRREQLSTEVLGSALDWVLSGSRGATPAATDADGSRPALLGSPVDERGLRTGLERSYRVLARLAQRGEERIELVERANRFRPRTWV